MAAQINKILTGGVIAVAAIWLIRGIARKGEAIKNLNVNVTKVDWNQKNKTFVVFVRMINPANSSITIKNIVGDVLWNGTTSATIDFRNQTKIGPGEETTIQVPVKLNLQLATLVMDILTKKLKDIANGVFEVKGVVNAEGLVVPFNYTQNIKFGA
jgi:LEA14-like dessication related protein